MQLNKALAVKPTLDDWEPSDTPGGWRKNLAIDPSAQNQSTYLVRYDAGVKFPLHSHPNGEEIFVLDGTLIDENGKHPAGTYLRYPPGSSHTPRSEEGTTLLVKCNQFHVSDRSQVIINTQETDWLPGENFIEVMPLFEFEDESVALQKWPAGTKTGPHRHFGGEEVFILTGCIYDEYGQFPAGSWIRYPHNSEHFPFTEEETIFWIKSGHLLALEDGE
ncbi:MAG: anti-sigma factor ChrR (cupin superfamily) [Planctomycetota bacterium]|jgi:anti-sigma factor ChrR (cupin superfamily)